MKRAVIIFVSLVTIFAFGVVAVASALAVEENVLMKILTPGQVFPQPGAGKGGPFTLETPGGLRATCGESEIAVEVGNTPVEKGGKFAHLFSGTFTLKKCKHNVLGGGKCWTTPVESEEIVIPLGNANNPGGHVGLAKNPLRPKVPAVLLLVGKVEFLCKVAGANAKFVLEGNVIGEITLPALGVPAKNMIITFKQVKGTQELRNILLSLTNEELLEQDLKLNSPLGLELAGLEGEIKIEFPIEFELIEE